nr:hypothetical protein [Castellaniella sp.]
MATRHARVVRGEIRPFKAGVREADVRAAFEKFPATRIGTMRPWQMELVLTKAESVGVACA